MKLVLSTLSLREWPRLPFTARIEQYKCSLQARSLPLQGWGLIDLPLRATFSPAHPLARRDVPLARARGVRDRALREHRRSSASIPFSVLRARRAPGHSSFQSFCYPPLRPHRRVACLASHCARPTRAFPGRALREHRRPTGHPPILPLTEPPLPGYDSPHPIQP